MVVRSFIAALAVLALPAPIMAQMAADEAVLLETLRADPGNAPARLALGRYYYDNRRDRAAEFNIRQALAGGLDETGRSEARDLLEGLQKRRRWIFTADAALAPEVTREIVETVDTGPDVEPTQIVREESSGIGVIALADLEYRAPMGEDLRLSVQGFARTEAFAEDGFDTTRAILLAGPLWLTGGDNTVRARALIERQWFDGDVEFDAIGGELALQRSVTDRLRLFARLTVRDVDNNLFDGRDGQTYAVDADLGRYGLGGRFERVFALAFRNEAEAEDQAFWFGRIGAGAYREVPFALGIYAEPSIAWQSFDGPDPIALEDREDVTASLLLRVSKRDWRVFSAAPFVSIELSNTSSTVDRFDGTDTALQAGFTRSF